ncbi:MAG: oxygenase MpaB family protein [Acidimicrobiales bacterium]
MPAPELIQRRASTSIRRAIGLTPSRLPPCLDPSETYFPVDGISRIVHGDLSSMLVGGLGSLFFQMLHPHSMAGVAQHSRYKSDPRGRLLQTANFIGRTTYGSKTTAHADIRRVLAVHQAVRGVADDGATYFANDPHLLAWVHACEVSMFLRGYQIFGALTLSKDDADTYVNEMSTLARDLGAENPPTSVEELDDRLESYRPELRFSADALAARDFVTLGYMDTAAQRAVYRLLVDSALNLLTPWARELLEMPTKPVRSRLFTQPATHVVCWTMRQIIPPPTRVTLPG